MSNASVILPAIVAGYAPRKDGSFSIRFETQELTPQEVANLHSLHNQFGLVYFRPGENLTKSEIKELDSINLDVYDKPKTQSQRIRDHLFVLFQKDPQGYTEFTDYYRFATERIISQLKTRIQQYE